jgi:predicted membrane-bound mannosyltransferase
VLTLMGDRPAPNLSRWHELTVPPEDLAELAAWLTELCEIRSGRTRPGSVPQRRVTTKLAAYRDLVERGAREVAAARAAACAAPTPARLPVVAPAQPPASSEEEWITTQDAHNLTGLTQESMRILAASGKVRARRTAGRAWLLDRDDVIALTRGRSTDGTGSSKEQPGPSAA